MKTTDYFRDNVLPKRPYIRAEWCDAVIAHPLKREYRPRTDEFATGAGLSKWAAIYEW